MKATGYVLSGSTQDLLTFVVLETEKVSVNNYYFIKHPLNGRNVLVRSYKISPYNPEMVMGRTGPLAGKKGRPAQYGKKIEYDVAFAEILGYFDDEHKWRAFEFAPSAWTEVYEPTEKELRQFFIPEKIAAEAHFLEIGKVRGTKIPVYLDLNAIAKSHMLVAGMTRSGKSSFVINLVANANKLKPRPRFVILDRRGEYGVLQKYDAKILPYSRFTPSIEDPDEFVRKLEVKSKDRDVVRRAASEMIEAEESITREIFLEKMKEVADAVYAGEEARQRAINRINWSVQKKGEFLDVQREPLDIVKVVRETPVLILDYSVDTDAEAQQMTTREIIRSLMAYAMERKDAGDFAAIMITEEAQYFAPERGLHIDVGAPSRIGVDKAFVGGISQAGGYNLGFIVMTQRPAYVMKSVISQCNSVACFRVKSGNDQDAILMYTEYGSERLRDYLPGLADHEAILWGLAVPTPFPIIAEIRVKEYPKKAAVFAKEAWLKMSAEEAG